ncbi:hypothetical protein BWI96_04290 [Siphonobacter sp. SORGH_AS_0500]|uniref:DUF389 domain-containing protein n=1 Tax=Siphonobacter sp. SORGH_AS_0500 TaxID=1864824 RepID=UPI000CC44DD9|nr:DUF389 domain-containing protein [Siphonobacter sp. SORGH_AS_0500]PKK37694.1 hypothetical protein BWI96_04290 [Siphonobacter sp. SORGH_AS_0500]
MQLNNFRLLITRLVSLEEDKEQEQEIVQSIKKGAVLWGTNLWVLVAAVFIASIGLNINSTSVIIGAMLISPLMGPIYGIGLSLATYDFAFFKSALRNLLIFVLFSLGSSTIYFWLSPLKEVQPEMIAYTHPSVWDVLVALIGGVAGIVGASRTRKGTIVTGVAIATGMMLPLCTAGYGIANQNWSFVAGAFYLFTINGICIAFSTYLVVRYLNFEPYQYVEKETQNWVRRTMTWLMILTLLPSIYLAYQLVADSIYRRNLKLFIDEKIRGNNHYVIQQTVLPSARGRKVELLIVGQRISSQELDSLKSQLPRYRLDHTELSFRYGFDDTILAETSRSVLTETEKLLLTQRMEMDSLRKNSQLETQTPQIAQELKAIYPEIVEVSIGKHLSTDGTTNQEQTVCLLKMAKPDGSLLPKVQHWLAIRLRKPEAAITVLIRKM